MAEIRDGVFVRNETNRTAMGGTERMVMQLANLVEVPLLREFQIVASRKRELQEDKIRIFWAHDLPGDPESEFLKDKSNHDLFHKYVFVSNWQMQGYTQAYGLPWSKCIVLKNAIEPIPAHQKPDRSECLRFIYTPTPQRGLDILVHVFAKLAETFKHIHLDVYSSFELYGWKDRDDLFSETFKMIDDHPQMTNHGSVNNEKIRQALMNSHVFAYPSVWPETSCICLIEAMSAGLSCIHSNYGALYETSADWTTMYQLNENSQKHAELLFGLLHSYIQNHANNPDEHNLLSVISNYTNSFYSWDLRAEQWTALLRGLLLTTTDRSIPSPKFVYTP